MNFSISQSFYKKEAETPLFHSTLQAPPSENEDSNQDLNLLGSVWRSNKKDKDDEADPWKVDEDEEEEEVSEEPPLKRVIGSSEALEQLRKQNQQPIPTSENDNRHEIYQSSLFPQAIQVSRILSNTYQPIARSSPPISQPHPRPSATATAAIPKSRNLPNPKLPIGVNSIFESIRLTPNSDPNAPPQPLPDRPSKSPTSDSHPSTASPSHSHDDDHRILLPIHNPPDNSSISNPFPRPSLRAAQGTHHRFFVSLYIALSLLQAVSYAYSWWYPSSNFPSRTLPPLPPALSTLLTLSLLFSLLILSLLLRILAARASQIFLLTLLIFPITCVLVGIVSWGLSYGEEGRWGSAGRWVGVGCLITGGWEGWKTVVGKDARREIKRAGKVVELSATLITEHLPILLLPPIILSILSFILFIPLLSLPITSITPSSFLSALYLLWTLSLLRSLSRHISSGLTSSWYFLRNDPSSPFSSLSGSAQLQLSFSRALGSRGAGVVCLEGFLGATVAIVVWMLRRVAMGVTALSSSPGVGLMLRLICLDKIGRFLLGWLERGLVSSLGNGSLGAGRFAVVYSAITGESYFDSGKKFGNLLTSNGTTILAGSLLSSTLPSRIALSISLLVGFISFLILTHKSPSSYALSPVIGAVVVGWVNWWNLRYLVGVVGDVGDALFACVNLDLEREVVHWGKAFEAVSDFSGFESMKR